MNADQTATEKGSAPEFFAQSGQDSDDKEGQGDGSGFDEGFKIGHAIGTLWIKECGDVQDLMQDVEDPIGKNHERWSEHENKQNVRKTGRTNSNLSGPIAADDDAKDEKRKKDEQKVTHADGDSYPDLKVRIIHHLGGGFGIGNLVEIEEDGKQDVADAN